VTQEEAAAALATLDCRKESVSATPPGPKDYVAACSTDGTSTYVLGPTLIAGTQIDKAAAGYDSQNLQGWLVQLTFKSAGANIWASYTASHIGTAVAFTLDQRVVSAPVIQDAIAGTTQITGDFNQETATDLANSLNYGALPLNFRQSQARTVSATLGIEQLEAGLIAGGIGLALVVIYCLIYYRLMGLVTIASLVISAALVYACLVVLGRSIGFTLTLAGIAGFIVAIGITADSFVIFFERLKDEIREGRSPRSAVPRAWVRSRRTILSADAVSFLAAAILYLLAVGEVQGFAFTLGLSTLLDLLVVFLFTHPLVAWMSRFKAFSSPRISGLGAVMRSPAAVVASSARQRATVRQARAATGAGGA
jgi:preprotein translocase subunit SecD